MSRHDSNTPTRFGKYVVSELIGEGGFGEVFRGHDPDLKRPVAIKTCRASDPELRERFLHEAEISARLQHPNVVTVHDFGHQDGVPYLVQEFLEGEDLNALIARGEPRDLAGRLDILVAVAAGLAHAHDKGIVHRDVKPHNVRITKDGQVKVIDFGIAKLLDGDRQLTRAGMTLGTAGYLPPEQLLGQEIDHRADIFSFGVLTYEAITGMRPFDGKDVSTILFRIAHEQPKPLRELWRECPPDLDELVERCLRKDPKERWSDFATLGRRLGHLADSWRGEESPDSEPAGQASQVSAPRRGSEAQDAASLGPGASGMAPTAALLTSEPAPAAPPPRPPEPPVPTRVAQRPGPGSSTYRTALRLAGPWGSVLLAVLAVAIAGSWLAWLLDDAPREAPQSTVAAAGQPDPAAAVPAPAPPATGPSEVAETPGGPTPGASTAGSPEPEIAEPESEISNSVVPQPEPATEIPEPEPATEIPESQTESSEPGTPEPDAYGSEPTVEPPPPATPPVERPTKPTKPTEPAEVDTATPTTAPEPARSRTEARTEPTLLEKPTAETPAEAEIPKPDPDAKIPIAVLPLGLTETAHARYPQLAERSVGLGIHSRLVDLLYDTGRFRFVADKPEITRDILERQWVASGGKVDAASAVAHGRLLGARYVLYGEVFDFAVDRRSRRETETRIAIQIRMVDVETSEYIPASGRANLVREGDVFPGEVSLARSTVGLATDEALKQAAAQLMRRFDP